MESVQPGVNVSYLRGNTSSLKNESEAAEQESHLTIDEDAQDDQTWDAAFAASQDTLARLAAQSRAYRAEGRTKRINP